MRIQSKDLFSSTFWPEKLLGLAQVITLSSGWKRRCIAFVAGACGALSLPPIGFFPALSMILVPLVWLLDGCSSPKLRQFKNSGFIEAWEIGWFAGFGYFVAGLWWLGVAFFVEADQFAWALPFGVIGLPAVLACFTGVGTVLAKFFWYPGSSRVLALCVGLGLAEWARGYLFTGFPWNSFGMALGSNLVLAQSASLIGLHGLTLLAVFIFASPATLLDHYGQRIYWRSPILISAFSLFLILIVFGVTRVSYNQSSNVDGISLRLVQPNVAQDDKFRLENREAIMSRYIELSSADRSGVFASSSPTHIFWPESPFPFVLGRDARALSQISALLNGQAHLVTGAARAEPRSPSLPGEAPGTAYFNSIQVVGPQGSILESYDKVHLVPFGEYIPFASLMDVIGLRQFVQIPGGFEPGVSRHLMAVPRLPPVFPLICYEAVFPSVLEAELRQHAGLIINVTNDGWFGNTPGPYQHFAQARLRAIELGLPLIRVANTGISAIIDPYGRVIGSLPMGVAGVIDSDLPASIRPTVFSAWPRLSLLACFACLFAAYLISRARF